MLDLMDDSNSFIKINLKRKRFSTYVIL